MQIRNETATWRATLRVLTPGVLLAIGGGVMAAEPEAGVAQPEEKPKWESSVGLGLTLSAGNSDNILFTANAGTQRKWERNELQFGATGGYGESRARVVDPTTGEVTRQTTKNTDFVRGFGQSGCRVLLH
jgi:hypothetical protein